MLPPTLHAEIGTVSLPASGNYIGLNIVDCVVTGFHGRPIGQAIIFCTCGFFFLLFFLAYSQRPQIGCLPYFHTWCGLSANLECRYEMCCTRLAGNTGRCKNYSNDVFSKHKPHAWPPKLTFTLKLVRARDQIRLRCEFGANPFSSSRDISYANKKSQTAPKTEPYAVHCVR